MMEIFRKLRTLLDGHGRPEFLEGSLFIARKDLLGCQSSLVLKGIDCRGEQGSKKKRVDDDPL
jgi:hypothetical protein